MDSFLTYIEGQSGEDLTSSVLTYLFEPGRNKTFLKMFLLKLLPEKYGIEGSLNDIEVTFQGYLGKYGWADILFESSSILIVLENKFFADFSQNDQIKRYLNYLQEQSRDRLSILVLLTPYNRGNYYLSKVQDQIDIYKECQITYNKRKHHYLISDKIKFIWLPWEELLSDFDCGNIIVEHLDDFITSKYLINTVFAEEELKMINDDSIPNVLEKLWGTVDKSKDGFSSKYEVKNTTQSRLVYGFHINTKIGKVWFGLYTISWKEYGHPFTLQIRKDWVDNNINTDKLNSFLEEIGFKTHKDLEYVYPIKIENPDAVGDVITQVENVITSIEDKFYLQAPQKQ